MSNLNLSANLSRRHTADADTFGHSDAAPGYNPLGLDRLLAQPSFTLEGAGNIRNLPSNIEPTQIIVEAPRYKRPPKDYRYAVDLEPQSTSRQDYTSLLKVFDLRPLIGRPSIALEV